jgi:hypothetical protein
LTQTLKRLRLKWCPATGIFPSYLLDVEIQTGKRIDRHSWVDALIGALPPIHHDWLFSPRLRNSCTPTYEHSHRFYGMNTMPNVDLTLLDNGTQCYFFLRSNRPNGYYILVNFCGYETSGVSDPPTQSSIALTDSSILCERFDLAFGCTTFPNCNIIQPGASESGLSIPISRKAITGP